VDLPVLAGSGADGSPSIPVAERAARAWLAGGIVGLPTETVYGLAADAQDARAVGRVYAAKGRPPDHPLIVHVAGAGALDGWSADRNEVAHRLADAFWPGPLTLIVRRSARAGDFITGGQETVALRCPDHPVAQACLAALVAMSGDAARGVAAPSANRFGRVSPTRAADVVAELGDRLDPMRDLVVDGGACAVGVESTIVDCTADPPRVLRLGAISQAEVDAALASGPADEGGDAGWGRGNAGPAELPGWADAPTGQHDGGDGAGESRVAEVGGRAAVDGLDAGGSGPVRAPGTLESHYAPTARVVPIERPAAPSAAAAARESFPPGRIGLVAEADVPTPDGWTRLAAPATPEDYARDLYAALRQADELGLATVVAVLPDPDGGPLAQAARDRLARAAHGK
jgi:L-threonylcarbamoyladenylate synthase